MHSFWLSLEKCVEFFAEFFDFCSQNWLRKERNFLLNMRLKENFLFELALRFTAVFFTLLHRRKEGALSGVPPYRCVHLLFPFGTLVRWQGATGGELRPFPICPPPSPLGGRLKFSFLRFSPLKNFAVLKWGGKEGFFLVFFFGGGCSCRC